MTTTNTTIITTTTTNKNITLKMAVIPAETW
jgi:hypothetical protein